MNVFAYQTILESNYITYFPAALVATAIGVEGQKN
jgi:hypothetical protein